MCNITNITNIDFENIEQYYDVFEIKTNGKKRIIAAPKPELKELQREVLSILEKYYNPKSYIHGFVKGKSIRTCLMPHIKNDYVMSVDFKSFFPSWVKQIIIHKLRYFIPEFSENEIYIISKLCTYNGKMVLGSPISPILTNIFMQDFDELFYHWCKEHDIVYTRYADDIILSRNANKFNKYVIIDTINYFLIQTDNKHIKINNKKVRYGKTALLGLNINGDVSVSKRKIRSKLRAILFSWGTKGLELSELDEYHKGLLAYIKGVNNKQYKALIDNYNKGYKFYLERYQNDKREQ